MLFVTSDFQQPGSLPEMQNYPFKSNFLCPHTLLENNLDMVKYNPNILHAIAFMTIMLFACDNKTVDPQKFNEVIATIVEVTPGQTLNFKATGTNAMMEVR